MKILFFIVTALLLSFRTAGAGPGPDAANGTAGAAINNVFRSGEKLVYNISWSDVIRAGVAVLEVKEEKSAEGKAVYRISSEATSVGVVSRFFPVKDTIVSIMDARELCSLSFTLDENHNKRTRFRQSLIDQVHHTVQDVLNENKETGVVPDRVQDALSSLYYLRTRKDLAIGTSVVIDVHDSGKNWSVEVQILARERITTPLGAFNAIAVKTYPKYDGVFQHKGEIYVWLTDDARKVPLLMKSKIAIGSIVATLVEMRLGDVSK